MSLRFRITAGGAATPDLLEEYISFLKAGGAIKFFKTARERLQSALVIVELESELGLVGMGAVKARCMEYNEKISERSGFNLNPYMREIGYIAVVKRYQGRGFAKEIVRRLLDFDNRVFATTSNPAMKAIFHGFGFVQRGEEWPSKEGDMLSLWVKNNARIRTGLRRPSF